MVKILEAKGQLTMVELINGQNGWGAQDPLRGLTGGQPSRKTDTANMRTARQGDC